MTQPAALSVTDWFLTLTAIWAAGSVSLSIGIAFVENDRKLLKERKLWGLSILSWGLTLAIGWVLGRLSIFNGFVHGPTWTTLIFHVIVVASVYRAAMWRAAIWTTMAFGFLGTTFIGLGLVYEFFLRGPR